MFTVGSTSSAWKIAKVATGSTAEIIEPKAKLDKNEIEVCKTTSQQFHSDDVHGQAVSKVVKFQYC
jgi:hypothetical protein